MRFASVLFWVVTLFALTVWGQVPGNLSFLSTTSPSTCNTTDNTIVTTQQLFGSGPTGFGCLKTLIIPQFAVGSGWTSQGTTFLPTQAGTTGLVNGTVPSFRSWFTTGSGAQVTLPGSSTAIPFNSASNGCLGGWDTEFGATFPFSPMSGVSFRTDSGGANPGTFTSLATWGACTGGPDTQLAGGFAQGPMQIQIVAPNATTLSQASALLSYFFQNATSSWQVSVVPVDINSAKTKWTAPLFQGNGYVTAFTVVNASNASQSVHVVLRDTTGTNIGTVKGTPALAPGCGCNVFGQSAAGGFFADTVPDFFGDIGTQTGTIEFTGTGNFIVLVLSVINNTLGSVPAR